MTVKVILEVPLEDIILGDNPRGRVGNTTDLQASIKERGLLQPLTVRSEGEKFMLLSGYRRLKAVKALGWETVPIAIIPESDEVDLADMLAANLYKAPDLLSEAMAVRELMKKKGWSVSRAGRVIGRSVNDIKTMADLLEADESVQNAVVEGRMSLTAFRAICKESKERQRAIVEDAKPRNKDGKLTITTVKAARDKVRGQTEKRIEGLDTDGPVQLLNAALALVGSVKGPFDSTIGNRVEHVLDKIISEATALKGELK